MLQKLIKKDTPRDKTWSVFFVKGVLLDYVRIRILLNGTCIISNAQIPVNKSRTYEQKIL